MSGSRLSDAELLERLNANPLLRGRIESLLEAVGNEMGDMREADAAETRIIDEMRQMGRESLTAWARGQMKKAEEEVIRAGLARRHGKKNSTGTPPLAK